MALLESKIKIKRGRAKRVIDYIEKLTVPSGAREGQPFKLDAFQKKFIRAIYEPHSFTRGQWIRIVQRAILSIARKNGKTALIACLVLVHLHGPEAETNGEIYSAANDKAQAAQVFKFARQIVEADAELTRDLDVVPSTKTIFCPSNGTFYTAISREAGTKHGLNPSLVIFDELAQTKDRDLFDTLDTSMDARSEPLFIVISTQSKDPQHIMSQLVDDGQNAHDPTTVCHLYEVPEKDDIFDERVWKKANPALGSFLNIEKLRAQAEKAKRLPSFENAYCNLRLNQRVDASNPLITRRDWNDCYDEDCILYPGEDIYLSLDLSQKNDLTALGAISANEGDRTESTFWKPADTIEEHERRDRAPYDKWVKEGHLMTTPGKVVEYEYIAQKLVYYRDNFNVLGVAYDRWRIEDLIKALDRNDIESFVGDADEGEGLRLVNWGQGFKDMGPAVSAFEDSIINGDYKHQANPVMGWCISNAVPISDPAGNRKLDKTKTRFRIDGAVTAVMAIGLKARDMAEPEDNIDDFINNPLGARV